MKTIISHFYNEEYLLPFWLNHHKKYFDHGIMIDYGSTDKSVEIIKEICPDWEIHPTRNQYFYAPDIDFEIYDYEKNLEGFRVCLNTTEFLFGDYELLDNENPPAQHLIGCHFMVDKPGLEYTHVKENLFKERQFGIKSTDMFCLRSARSLHNFSIHYPSVTGPGRHFRPEGTNPHSTKIDERLLSSNFFILWYGFSPFNEELIKRKLQIQTKHHPNGTWTGGHNVDRDTLIGNFTQYQSLGQDLSEIINKYI
jgi:hypothetical protein